VICRGDGSPLYNFATAVDDAQMQITHVIRAEEHLSNTPVQVLLHQALGNKLPTYAHIPYVAAPGTKVKMSKRKVDKYRKNAQFKSMFEAGDSTFSRLGINDTQALNPVMVEYYEKIGYLPAGVLNALGRLGWSLDDKTEIFSLDDLVAHFTLDRVVRNPAGLDPEKLMSFQAHWMNQLADEEKVAGCLPSLSKAGFIEAPPTDKQTDLVKRLIPAIGDRLKLFSDILLYEEFFAADDKLEYNDKDFKKRIQKPAASAGLLKAFRTELAESEAFDADSLDKLLHRFVDEKSVQIGDIIHALRVATTGKAKGPGMFDCLALLGKASCCARIDRALSKLDS
jgi:glutamyl-tRNA synthetase